MDTKQKRLKAKISLALLDTLGRQPTRNEVDKYFIAAQVLWKTVLGTKSARGWMKKNNQIPLF